MNYSVTLRRVISLDSFSCASNGGSIFLDVVADGVREARIFNCSNRVSNKTTGWREEKGERERILKRKYGAPNVAIEAASLCTMHCCSSIDEQCCAVPRTMSQCSTNEANEMERNVSYF